MPKSVILVMSDIFIQKHIDRYIAINSALARRNIQMEAISFSLPIITHVIFSSPNTLKNALDLVGTYEKLQYHEQNQIKCDSARMLDEKIRIIYGHNMITRNIYDKCLDIALSEHSEELFELKYKGVSVGDKLRRDLSICLKCRKNILELDEGEIAFLRISALSALLYVEILEEWQSLCNEEGTRTKDKIGLVPDKYTGYMCCQEYLYNKGIKSSIISASPYFDNHLVIESQDPYATTISKYALQEIGYEYGTAKMMFDYARAYIEKKIIVGGTNQSFSIAGIPKDEAKTKIQRYISEHGSVICYFTSSPDEESIDMHYADNLCERSKIRKGIQNFSNESELLTSICKYCKENNKGLIVRFHPRMGARNRVSSQAHRSSGLEILSNVIEEVYPETLIIEPEDPISSYWLASQEINALYFKSSIGIELCMIGITAFSPNGADSLSNTGYPFQVNSLPSTKKGWFDFVSNQIQQEDVSYYSVYSAVRAFYISQCCDRFTVKGEVEGSEDHLLPPSDDEFVYESIVKRSSIQLPKYRGYWTGEDITYEALSYLKFLSGVVHPSMGMNKGRSKEIMKRQVEHLETIRYKESI